MALPITILHLTDLHFGSAGHYWSLLHENTEFQRQARDRRGLLGSLIRDLRGLDVRPNIVAVTGDLLDKCDDTGIKPAVEFLTSLAGELALPRDRFALVPGNHDVRRDLPYEDRYAHFDEIRHTFYGNTRPVFGGSLPSHRRVEHFDFIDDLGLEIIGLNSCEGLDTLRSEGKEEKEEHGSVGVGQRDEAEKYLRRKRGPDALRVALMHHHLRSPEGIVRKDLSLVYDATSILHWLADHRVHLALHGHQHVDWQEPFETAQWRIVVAAGASLGVGDYGRKQWQLRLGYQLIVLDGPTRGKRIRREYDPQRCEWRSAREGDRELVFGPVMPAGITAPLGGPTDKDYIVGKAKGILLELFDDPRRIKMIFEDAGGGNRLVKAIRFDQSPDLIWHDVLDISQRQEGLLRSIVARAAEDYPRNPALRELCRAMGISRG